MADLDLDAIEDAVALGSKGNARTTLALVAEVRRLRADNETLAAELRRWAGLAAEAD